MTTSHMYIPVTVPFLLQCCCVLTVMYCTVLYCTAQEYWASRQTPTQLVPGYTILPMHEALRYSGTFPMERGLTKGTLEDRRQLVLAADQVGAWIQSLTAGVPANKRQVGTVLCLRCTVWCCAVLYCAVLY